jgi:hypothetical protein
LIFWRKAHNLNALIAVSRFRTTEKIRPLLAAGVSARFRSHTQRNGTAALDPLHDACVNVRDPGPHFPQVLALEKQNHALDGSELIA